jgi:TPR repeat protein
MQRTIPGLLFLLTSCACLAGNDVWETLFREKLEEANAGNSHAQYDVGTMYQNGRGVAASRKRAIEWYQKAAAQNDQQAASRLRLIQSNEDRYHKTLLRARQGDVESQYDLGNMYSEGIGVNADMSRAREWYGKAASQGYVKAQYKLGLNYYEADHSPKHLALAFTQFRKAAEKGYPPAQFHLGKMYASGEGVRRNYETALKWFSRAADGGFNEARREMIDIAELLEDRPADRYPEMAQAAGAGTEANAQGNPPGHDFETLMLASWNRDSQPVAYLPSAINTCREENDQIICFSDGQSRTTASGMINYKTKAIISRLSTEGAFEIVYRNLVIDATKEAAHKKAGSDEVLGSINPDPVKMNYAVKTGWGKEHRLQCQFRDSSTLSCLKNNTHAFLLEGSQTLAAGR